MAFFTKVAFIFLNILFLLTLLNAIPHPETGRQFKLKKFGNGLGDKFLGPHLQCAVCNIAAEGILDIYSKQSTEECIEAIAVKVCELLHIDGADDMVCISIIPQFLDEVLYILGELVLIPSQLCNFLLNDQCGTAYHPKDSVWNVAIPTPKPPPVEPTLPANDSPTLKVLHLSDIHFDKLYQPGADVQCNEPLCCRLYEDPINGTSDPAGQFGMPQGNCDIPLWTLENLFQHLQANETFDYVIWTGDLPAHNVWNQTKEDQLAAYKVLTDLFLQYFPNKTIYSAVGNHESSPVNNFAPHYPGLPKEFAMTWLYDALADSWTNWVNKSQIANIQNIASYMDKPFSGLRIISLNTIYCESANYWVFLNETDPDGALTWLVSQLQDAEDAGDKVHIIGHILPGSCMPQWSLNYFNIIYRYENTVTGQFFGHSHSDQYAVFYENFDYTQRPFSMYYVGPSVTTYSGRNPAYRLYTVDGNYHNSSFRVLNHDTYYLNLSKANAQNSTRWEHEYDAKSAYGLTTLFPQDWSDLTNTMKENNTIFRLYNTFYNRQPSDCEGGCVDDMLCDTRSAVANYHSSLCSDLYNNEMFYYEESGWLQPMIAQLTKAFPKGIKIDVPSACEASTSTTTTRDIHVTTQKCDCGSATSTKPYFVLFLLAYFFILLCRN